MTTTTLSPTTVRVGDGITQPVGSDRYAATVTWVSKSGKTIRYTLDKVKALGDYYANPEYEFTPVEEKTWTVDYGSGYTEEQTNVRTARWSEKRQRFVQKGGGQGVYAPKSHYIDPSF